MVRGLGACIVALAFLWMVLAPSTARAYVDLGSGLPRSVVPSTGPAVAPARSVGRFAPDPETTRLCDLEAGADSVDATRSEGIVTIAYCLLLKRLPDAEGLAYWSAEIDQGSSPVQVARQLADSPEYRARGVRGFRSSLTALTALTPTADSRDRRRDEAQSSSPAAPDVAASQDAGLRPRAEMSQAEFGNWVTGIGPADLEYVTPALVHQRRSGGGQRINVVFVHLSATRGVSVSPGGRRASKVGSWAAEIGADVAVNGNWYAPFDGPAVSNGSVYGGPDHHYTAVFGFTAEGDAMIEHHREINEQVDGRIIEAVAGHPTLIHRGRPTTDFGNDPTFTARHPRTAIGLDRTGDVLILVTIDGRRSTARGMTGAETAELMVDLGAHDAVMLDGGGSTTMWVAGKGIVNSPSGPPRAVGNQLAVFGD